MNATTSSPVEFEIDRTCDVTVSIGRTQTRQATPGFVPWNKAGRRIGACRAWPTARGLIYAVEGFRGLAGIVKYILESEGFPTCDFEDRATAWQAFAFADPRPALLITDNLDGDAAAMDLIERCRTVEPTLKTLLVDHHFKPNRPKPQKVDALLPLPYCASDLVREVRRLCPAVPRTGRQTRSSGDID